MSSVFWKINGKFWGKAVFGPKTRLDGHGDEEIY
jgi:hypothetical protein